MLELVLISLAAAVAPPFVVAARRAMLSHKLAVAIAQSDIQTVAALCEQASQGSWLPAMNKSEAHFYKAMAYCSRRMENQAKDCFLAIDPSELHPAQRQYLPLLDASLRSMAHDISGGLAVLQKVDLTQLDPTAEATFHLLEAELLAQDEKPLEAAKLLEPWLDRPLGIQLLALIRNNWAWFTLEGGTDPIGALHRSQQALAIMPESGPFQGTYGVALHASGGDAGAAIEALEKALQQPERTLPAYIAADHYYLGCCFESLTWREQAIHHFTEALEAAPHSRWARLASQKLEAIQNSDAEEWRWE